MHLCYRGSPILSCWFSAITRSTGRKSAERKASLRSVDPESPASPLTSRRWRRWIITVVVTPETTQTRRRDLHHGPQSDDTAEAAPQIFADRRRLRGIRAFPRSCAVSGASPHRNSRESAAWNEPVRARWLIHDLPFARRSFPDPGVQCAELRFQR